MEWKYLSQYCSSCSSLSLRTINACEHRTPVTCHSRQLHVCASRSKSQDTSTRVWTNQRAGPKSWIIIWRDFFWSSWRMKVPSVSLSPSFGHRPYGWKRKSASFVFVSRSGLQLITFLPSRNNYSGFREYCSSETHNACLERPKLWCYSSYLSNLGLAIRIRRRSLFCENRPLQIIELQFTWISD